MANEKYDDTQSAMSDSDATAVYIENEKLEAIGSDILTRFEKAFLELAK